MSKRDYKTSIADGMELEPLGGAGAVDKENSKTNGTQFGEGKCFECQTEKNARGLLRFQPHSTSCYLYAVCVCSGNGETIH